MLARREEERGEVRAFLVGGAAVLVGIPSLAGLLQLFDSGVRAHRGVDTVEAACLTVLIAFSLVVLLALPGARLVWRSLRDWLRRFFVGLKRVAGRHERVEER